MKVAITAVLALGVGLAAATTGQAAAIPAGGLQAALAAQEGIKLAQVNPVVRGARPGVRGPAVRGPVVRGPVVRGGPRVVGPRGVVVGRPGFVGRGAYVRGYRPWYRRAYFGTIVGGIALGTILTVAAVGVPPPAPSPDLCWFWADPSQTTGYWDYCQ